jgi:hypothetical protein
MEENMVQEEVTQEPAVANEDEEVYEDEEEAAYRYDPNVEEVVPEDDPNVPIEEIETFKIDENMPPELKAQLERFNKQTETLNSVMNADFSEEISETADEDDIDEEETEGEEGTTFDIQEDESVEFGNLF